MIKLENVSTTRLMEYASRFKNRSEILNGVYEILSKHDIKDYEMLKRLLNVCDELKDDLSWVEEKIASANSEEKESVIFTFDAYDNSIVDKDTLHVTDCNNKGDILLFQSPFVMGGARFNQIKPLTINELKYLCSHLNSYSLQNELSEKRSFGKETVSVVADRIKFYEQQVLRQAEETTQTGINLFTLNKKEKEIIVEDQVKEIIEYIVDNADTCIWGQLSDTQKNKMIRAALSTRGEHTQQDKENLINMISNYTTLSELEQGVVKKRTLDRFIIR